MTRYICHECVADPVIKAEIRKAGRKQTCEFCGKGRKAIPLEDLATRVDAVYRAVVRMVPELPVVRDGHACLSRDGRCPSDIVAEMLECEDDLAVALVRMLHDRHGYAVARDGAFEFYDDSSYIYEVQIPLDPRFRETWSDFCESVKHRSRFFNPSAKAHLDSILGAALNGGWPGRREPVRTIGGPGDAKHRHVLRARLANGEASRRRIYSAPARELGPPPRSACSPGRMNAAGISVFYGAFDVDTCIAETRVPVGGAAVVGKFEIVRPLRVLDLRAFDEGTWGGSLFDPDFMRNYAHVKFLRGFHEEVRRPVLPNTETLEYLPTQAMAEYLAAIVEPPIDGIMYSSVQTEGVNVAIFPHACTVEPDGECVDEDRIYIGYDEDGEEEYVLIDPPREAAAAPLPATDPWALPEDSAVVEPTLRLDEVITKYVKAVRYVAEGGPVRIHRLDSDPDF